MNETDPLEKTPQGLCPHDEWPSAVPRRADDGDVRAYGESIG